MHFPTPGPPNPVATFLGIEAHWGYVQTDVRAQEEARKMHCNMPAWKLRECVRLMKAQPPDLKGTAKMSNVYFSDVQFVEAAFRTITDLFAAGETIF